MTIALPQAAIDAACDALAETGSAVAALIAAAPHMAAFPRCPTPCDADCEHPCHEVHTIPSQYEHDPERCVATIVAAAAAAERERIRQLAEKHRATAAVDCQCEPAEHEPGAGHYVRFADLLTDPKEATP